MIHLNQIDGNAIEILLARWMGKLPSCERPTEYGSKPPFARPEPRLPHRQGVQESALRFEEPSVHVQQQCVPNQWARGDLHRTENVFDEPKFGFSLLTKLAFGNDFECGCIYDFCAACPLPPFTFTLEIARLNSGSNQQRSKRRRPRLAGFKSAMREKTPRDRSELGLFG